MRDSISIEIGLKEFCELLDMSISSKENFHSEIVSRLGPIGQTIVDQKPYISYRWDNILGISKIVKIIAIYKGIIVEFKLSDDGKREAETRLRERRIQ